MSQLSLMFDLERCIGCKSCEAACKQEHGLGPGEFRNRVWCGSGRERGRARFSDGNLPTLRAACLPACLSRLIRRRSRRTPRPASCRSTRAYAPGAANVSPPVPYGAMGYDPRGHHAVKCDLCSDRRSEGLGPACASVCPGRAIYVR